jgi:hypothetical protein
MANPWKGTVMGFEQGASLGIRGWRMKKTQRTGDWGLQNSILDRSHTRIYADTHTQHNLQLFALVLLHGDDSRPNIRLVRVDEPMQEDSSQETGTSFSSHYLL